MTFKFVKIASEISKANQEASQAAKLMEPLMKSMADVYIQKMMTEHFGAYTKANGKAPAPPSTTLPLPSNLKTDHLSAAQAQIMAIGYYLGSQAGSLYLKSHHVKIMHADGSCESILNLIGDQATMNMFKQGMTAGMKAKGL